MKLLKIFREHVKMNLVHKKKFAGRWPANFWSSLGFSAGGVKFTPPPYEIGLIDRCIHHKQNFQRSSNSSIWACILAWDYAFTLQSNYDQ